MPPLVVVRGDRFVASPRLPSRARAHSRVEGRLGGLGLPRASSLLPLRATDSDSDLLSDLPVDESAVDLGEAVDHDLVAAAIAEADAAATAEAEQGEKVTLDEDVTEAIATAEEALEDTPGSGSDYSSTNDGSNSLPEKITTGTIGVIGYVGAGAGIGVAFGIASAAKKAASSLPGGDVLVVTALIVGLGAAGVSLANVFGTDEGRQKVSSWILTNATADATARNAGKLSDDDDDASESTALVSTERAALQTELTAETLAIIEEETELADGGARLITDAPRLAGKLATNYVKRLEVALIDCRLLTRRVESLEEALEDADREAADAQGTLRQRETEVRLRKSEAISLRVEFDSLQKRLTSAQANLDSVRMYQDRLERQADEAASEIASLTDKLRAAEAANQDTTRMREELEQLNASAVEAEGKLMQAEESVDDLATKAELNATELARLEEAETAASRTASEAQSEAAAALSRAVAAEARAENLAKQLDDLEHQAEVAQREMEETRRQVEAAASSTDTNASMEAVIEEAEAETRKMQDTKKSGLPALSRMRKAELVAECTERGIDASGTVPVLRARLRQARK